MLKLRAIEPGRNGSGGWQWTDPETGEKTSSIGYQVAWHGPATADLRLSYTTGGGGSTSWDYLVSLEGLPMPYGGHRWYWRCPHTGKRCRKLYLVHGRFVARTAIRPLPTYASQRAGRGLDRATARRWALRRRLGDPGDLFDELTKPKRMRWRTFQRYLDRDNWLAEAEDGALLGRIVRLMKATGGSS